MKTNSGFTLIELVIVVLILGILAAMGVPYYHKTLETTKAGDAVAMGYMIGNANRMFKLANPRVSLSGAITNSCGTSCDSTDVTGCRLTACGHLAGQNWDASSYDLYVCAGETGATCCAARAVSCVKRKSEASPTYAGWGYRFLDNGVCEPIGGAPDCGRF